MIPNDETAISRPSGPAPGGERVGRLAIGLALVALAFTGWQWWESRSEVGSLQQAAGQKLAGIAVEVEQSKAATAQVQAALKDMQSQVRELEARLADTQEQRVALEEMYRELSRTADDRMLAEVEQLMIIASQQLQLAGNVKGALIALQAADARLARADKLQVAQLRRTLNQDMERLRALPQVDTVGIAVKLDNLVAQVDALPLLVADSTPAARSVARARPLDEPGWSRVARDFWDEMKSLVRIRDLETSDAALLTPAQSYFLRENLKLRLLSARVSLLARDEQSYRDDLKGAQAWIQKYFDTRAKVNANTLETLKQLAGSPISISVPDINASLAAVRAARAAREKVK
jgi:uroporphyrin-III C-methyltransferase